MELGITISLIDYHGDLITDMQPSEHISPVTKQRQCMASGEKKLGISKGLLSQKLAGQRNVLKLLNADSKVIEDLLWQENCLKRCKTSQQLLEIEGNAARKYWIALEGTPLSWKPLPLQPHWMTVTNRTSLKSLNARNSINPFHSCLNYLYTCLESRIKKYAISYRIDTDFPVFHSGTKASRASLVYDLMEPIRPTCDLILYQYLSKTTLNPKDFHETGNGVCRISTDMAKQIIELIKQVDPVISQTVKDFSTNFKTKMRDVSRAA